MGVPGCINFRECVFLGPLMSILVVLQKLGMYLEQIGSLQNCSKLDLNRICEYVTPDFWMSIIPLL